MSLLSPATPQDDWPSHGQELARKSLTVIEQWMLDNQAGRITDAELLRLVGGIYDVTSGLMPAADMNVIANLHEELRRAQR